MLFSVQSGSLCALFNGVRQRHILGAVQDQNKGWSDYRIGFSKEIDLDILPHQVSLESYSATLGHKVGPLPPSLPAPSSRSDCSAVTPSTTTPTSSRCGTQGSGGSCAWWPTLISRLARRFSPTTTILCLGEFCGVKTLSAGRTVRSNAICYLG